MILFESNPGKVVRLTHPAVQAQARTINFASNATERIRYELQRSIITRATLTAQVNLQFLHTLGSKIYVYVFGDRIGQIALSGLAFGAPCEGAGGSALGLNSPYGSEQMLLWYKAHRAAARSNPLRLMVGNTPIDGFVVGFREDVVDAASSLTEWTVQMALLPDDQDSDDLELPNPLPIVPPQ